MKPSRFPGTDWSLVRRAASPEDAVRAQAISDLLAAYRPGLRRFLIDGRRLPADIADDILQDFIADKVLVSAWLQKADRDRGKFRSFLLKSLNNFANSRLRRTRALAAKTVGQEFSEGVAAPPEAGLECFEREWTREVVRSALTLMQVECIEQQRQDIWEILRLRIVEPLFDDVEPVDYEQIVLRLRLESPRQAINLLITAKRSFMRHLRVAVQRYAADDDEIDREIADLREICYR